jgi:hypothetical protein
VGKVWFFLLVTSPFLVFYRWLTWWLVIDVMCERRSGVVCCACCDVPGNAARPVDGAE